jgi:putative transport protein
MLHQLVSVFRANPPVVLFLSLAIGYLVGKIKIRGFSLGVCTCVLFVSLAFGQLDIEIDPMMKMFALSLLMFCMGYQIGPQFFESLKKEGGRYILLAVIVALSGLISAIILGRWLGFDIGTTAGLFGGGMTQITVIGTAEDALAHLSIPAAQSVALRDNIEVAYMATSIFGTIGLIVAFKVVTRLMKVNLKQEAKALESEMMIGGEAALKKKLGLFSWHKQLNMRAYVVQNMVVVHKTVSELEAMFPSRVAVDGIKRGSELIDLEQDSVIQQGDIVALVGQRQQFLNAENIIGPEVDDEDLMDLSGEVLEVCVLRPEAIGKTLAELSVEHGHGCFLRSMTRHGHELPLADKTIVEKCDILKVAGAQKDVERFVEYLGYPERATETTDFITVGLGCALGILLGVLTIPVFGVPITVGLGGGVLISGLTFGWLRSKHPTFGQIPSSAQWIFTDFGLNLFVACIGLSVGSSVIYDLEMMGPTIIIAGAIVTLTPMIVGLLFGKFVLKLNPLLLFAALSGAETMTPVLMSLKEESESSVATLGYTIPFAFANVFLTVLGAVIVNVMYYLK